MAIEANNTEQKTFSIQSVKSELAELLASRDSGGFSTDVVTFLEKLSVNLEETTRIIPPRLDVEDEYRLLCDNFTGGRISLSNSSGKAGLRAARWLLELGFGYEGVVHNADHTLITFSSLNENKAMRKPTIRITYSNAEFGFYIEYGGGITPLNKYQYVFAKTLNKDFWDYVVWHYAADNPEHQSIYAEYEKMAPIQSVGYLDILETLFN